MGLYQTAKFLAFGAALVVYAKESSSGSDSMGNMTMTTSSNSSSSGGSGKKNSTQELEHPFQYSDFQAALKDDSLRNMTENFKEMSKGSGHFNSDNSSRDNFDSYFNSSKSSNSYYAYKENKDTKRFVLALTRTNDTAGANSTGFLRFSVKNGPRIGVEWHHNGNLLNGTAAAPDISHAIRFYGMYETNQTYTNRSSFGTHYYFPDLTWSDISFNSSLIGGSQSLDISSSAVASDNLNFTIILHAQTDASSPFSLKYDFLINGAPTYSMTPAASSSWVFYNSRHNSMGGNETEDSSSTSTAGNITLGPTYFSWTRTVLLDGTSTNITVNTNELGANLTTSHSSESTREGKLDSYTSSRSLISFKIPYFTSSMVWDPSIGVSDTSAQQTYTAATSQTTTVKNAAFAGGKGMSVWGSLVVALCAFALL